MTEIPVETLVPGSERVLHQVQVGVEDDPLEIGAREEPIPFPDTESVVENDGDVIGPRPDSPVRSGVEVLQETGRDGLRAARVLGVTGRVPVGQVDGVPQLLRDGLVQDLDTVVVEVRARLRCRACGSGNRC